MERILHLTNNNELNNNVDMIKNCLDNNVVIIFKVAPWCGHCKRLNPVIDSLKEDILNDSMLNDLHLVKVNNDMTHEVGLEQSRTVPDISMSRNGTVISEHSGDRDSHSLMEFIKSNMDNSSRKSHSIDSNSMGSKCRKKEYHPKKFSHKRKHMLMGGSKTKSKTKSKRALKGGCNYKNMKGGKYRKSSRKSRSRKSSKSRKFNLYLSTAVKDLIK